VKARHGRVIGAAVAVAALAASAALAAPGQRSGPPYTVKFPWGTFELSARIADKLENKQPLNYALSIEGTGIPIFGAAMKAGFDRGVKKDSARHPIRGKVIGPINTDVPRQVSEINSLLNANQIDCLAFEAHEPGPYIDVINKAMAQGVPVFGVNADSPNSRRIAFYALDEESAGAVAGRITGQLIKRQKLPVKKAALLTGSPEGPWAQARMRGFMKGLKATVPGIEFKNSPKTAPGTTFDQATVYSKARAFITGNPDVQLVFHTDQGVEIVGKVIKDARLTGKVWTSGFNLSPAILDSITEGQILVSIGQGFNKQAEAGVHACTQFLLDGKVPRPAIQRLDPIPVTKANAARLARSVKTGGA
jgi:ABC-type sugar transport system substrate-binding protein